MIDPNWPRVPWHFRKWLPFREACAFARGLGLEGQREWYAFCKGQMQRVGRLPSAIPVTAWAVYANRGWRNWGDWLGTGNVANQLKKYRSFQEAWAFARKLKLKSGTEWRAFCIGGIPRLGRLPPDIPSTVDRVYADKVWVSWGDWLGTGMVAASRRTFRPFREARALARKLNLKGEHQWRLFCTGKLPPKGTRPEDIPAHPDRVYAGKGWVNWGDWLGTGAIASNRLTLPSVPRGTGICA